MTTIYTVISTDHDSGEQFALGSYTDPELALYNFADAYTGQELTDEQLQEYIDTLWTNHREYIQEPGEEGYIFSVEAPELDATFTFISTELQEG